MLNTRLLLAGSDFPAIFRKPLEILQVNLGLSQKSAKSLCSPK
jgi:hypothetical protein